MTKCRAILLIVVGVALFVAVAPLLPFHDDWTYLTAPHPEFSCSDLLPGAAFWRPFDALWGAVLGSAPWLFPWANRIAIVLGHVLCVWHVMRIVGLMKVSGAFAAVCFFALSSGIAACMVNTDSINLVWSCVWGCLGTIALLSGRPMWMWLACYAVSVLFKESGLSWLAVGPLLAFAVDSDGRRFVRGCLAGAGLFVVYMGLRFVLQGEVALGNGGDYALTLSPVTVGKNLAILVGMGLSSVDGLAWARGCLVLFVGTAVLSLLAWGAFGLSVDWGNRRDVLRRIAIGILVVLAFAAPHCLFKNHHPAEMHFYPVVLGGALLVGLLPVAAQRTKFFGCAAGIMACLFAVGWGDKLLHIYDTNGRAKALLAEIKASGKDLNTPSEYTVKSDPELVRYSVFSQSPAWCLDYGRALRSENGWRDSRVKIVEK